MPDPVVIGLLDSGAGGPVSAAVDAHRAFRLDAAGRVASGPPEEDRLGHGTDIARVILAGAPQVRFAVAGVFGASAATAPAVVAAGLGWLVEQRVRIVNMSFGLRADRPVLRAACTAAREAGVILVAAAPARGPAAFPGAYPGVLRISGDARCGPQDISDLRGGQADFGACPRGPAGPASGRPVGGASFATAHATAVIARHLAEAPFADAADVVRHLRRIARFHGPERRTADRLADG